MTEDDPRHETPPERRYRLDDRRNVETLFRALLIVCAGLFAADLFYDRHAKFALGDAFGFFAIFGFVACVFLVLAARLLRRLLMRSEDYYDR